MNATVVSIVGPTAVGKSKLGIEICKRFNGEVISGDSMQVYKGMDIGTAKVTDEEAGDIPHHMIDIKQPEEGFSAAEFQKRAGELIEEISSRGKLPVVVGGTGMYIQSLLLGYSFAQQPKDPEVRSRLESELKELGKDAMYKRLISADPEEAKKIHPNNTQRVIRALEISETTGKNKTAHQYMQQPPLYNYKIIGLEMERSLLYNRIDQRVNSMVIEGLAEEVKGLLETTPREAQAMKAIGYKELIPYIDGEVELDEAVELLKRNSRRYAKRQYTYFKNKLPIDWYEVDEANFSEKMSIILTNVEGFLHKEEK